MPAVSKKQRKAIAIAEHAPSKLFKRNKSLLSMDHADMHDFSSTSEAGLPDKVPSKSKKTKGMSLLQCC